MQMHMFPETLNDADLTLRPLAQSDVPTVTDQLNDGRIAQWLATVAPAKGAEAAGDLLDHSRHPGEAVRVILKEGQLVGGLCLGAALWYWLSPELWGQSVMRRALTLAIGARFASSAPPLVATCHADNVPSRALLARLGFAPSPTERRMFFHSSQRSEPCRDYLMAPEQWHLLHPPTITTDRVTICPAQQKHIPTLVRMLPNGKDQVWPDPGGLSQFVETHRFRGMGQGLFVILDVHHRMVGMALAQPRDLYFRFLTGEDDRAHRHSAQTALAALGV